MNLTAAVIGTGYMGKRHLDVLKDLGIRTVICGRDEKAGAELAQKYSAAFYTDYTAMLAAEKPDAVSVCLPTAMHYETVKTALLCGCAVLCEKPFTETSAQAAELCRIAKEQGRLLMVGHPLRFSPPYIYLKHCIADKRFGELRQLHMFRHAERPAWSAGGWLLNAEKSGGAVKDMHIHESDIVNYLLGMPESVMSVGDCMACTTVYRYSGRTAAITAAVSWRNIKGYPFSAGYDAVFENAAVECRGSEVTLCTDNSSANPPADEEMPDYCPGDFALGNEIAYFIGCLRDGCAPAACLPEDTLAAMMLNETEVASMTRGRELAVPAT